MLLTSHFIRQKMLLIGQCLQYLYHKTFSMWSALIAKRASKSRWCLFNILNLLRTTILSPVAVLSSLSHITECMQSGNSCAVPGMKMLRPHVPSPYEPCGIPAVSKLRTSWNLSPLTQASFISFFSAFLEEGIINIMKYIIHTKEYMQCIYVV